MDRFKPYCEIIQDGKVVKRIDEFLGDGISIRNELMYVPEVEITIPIYYKEFLYGRPQILIHIGDIQFHGIIYDPVEDKVKETITFTVLHVINEWYNREVSTNLAVKDRTISDLYTSDDFRYSNEWNIVFQGNAGSRVIDYVYSRQKYIDALTQTMELTDDLFWRVDLKSGRKIEIGIFGEKKPYTISLLDPSEQNMMIIEEPIVYNYYQDVINVVTVYGTKSDSGMSSMSLREVYNDPTKQKDGFPVIILKQGINNERDYNYAEYPMLASNNDLEYAIVDRASVALESGELIEGSYSFDDLSPFNTDGKTITDDDRIKASVTAYERAIKRLIAARRDFSISLTVSNIKEDINVGDQILFRYDNIMLLYGECGNYQKKILSFDEWFYITEINREIRKDGSSPVGLRLDKYLRIEREGE